jgi:hypothetical protein
MRSSSCSSFSATIDGRRIAAIVHDSSLAEEPELVRVAGAAARHAAPGRWRAAGPSGVFGQRRDHRVLRHLGSAHERGEVRAGDPRSRPGRRQPGRRRSARSPMTASAGASPDGGSGLRADAVRRVARGGSALDPEIVSRLVGRARPHPLAELTLRARTALGDGSGCSNHDRGPRRDVRTSRRRYRASRPALSRARCAPSGRSPV